MNPDRDIELEALSNTWQSDGGPALAEVKKEVRAALIRSRIALLLEVLVSLAGVAVGSWMTVRGELEIGLAAIVFSLFGGAAALYARGRTWRVSLTAISEEVKTLEKEARFMQRAGWAGLAVSLAAVAFLGFVMFAGSVDLASKRPKLLMLAALLFIMSSAAASVRMATAARRRSERLRDASKALNSGEG